MLFSGPGKVEFCKRLGDDWRHLADYLEIPAYDQARFGRGDEARGIWIWLQNRTELKRLPDALRAIGRADLTDILIERQQAGARSEPRSGKPGPQPGTRVQQIKRRALEQRLQSLLEDYQAATEQLAYALSAVDQIRLKRQVEALEHDMEETENQLDALER